jgi:hypothetical protein
LGACSTDDHDFRYGDAPTQPSGPAGTLEYHWSINGRQEAEDCVDVGAVLFESVVIDRGFVVDGVTVPCEEFEARLSLYQDDFLARSALTDARGYPALGRIIEDIFLIDASQVTTLVMDFPSAALPTQPAADAGTPPAEPAADAGAPDLVDAGADAGSP